MKKSVFPDKTIIPQYGKVLRSSSENTVVDLGSHINLDFDFQIHSIKDTVSEFNGYMPPNRISHYIIAFILRGSGKKTIGSYTFDIETNMAMTFPKGIIHSTNRWSPDTDGYMLTFSERIFEEYQFPASFLQLPSLFQFSVKPFKVFDPTLAKGVVGLFRQLTTYSDDGSVTARKLFILQLSELLLLYQKGFEVDAVSRNSNMGHFDRFAELLEENFRQHKEVKFYADCLLLNASHLNRIIQSVASVSAKQYILQRVMAESKYLLTATKITIKEIAYDLGYSDTNHFCRQFKKFSGTTPLEYRTHS